jgi:hypothetical protein
VAAALVLGACGGVQAGVTAGTAVVPAASLPDPTTTMVAVTATLPTVSAPPVPNATDVPETVPATTTPPVLPPPCDPAALAFAASQPVDGELIITITNGGGQRCEANLQRSPGVDPLMEPDVWIDPGASAELLVEIDTRICVAPLDVDAIDLVVNDQPLGVAVAPMRVCILSLTALYPA